MTSGETKEVRMHAQICYIYLKKIVHQVDSGASLSTGPPNVVKLEGNYSSTLEVWTVELIVGEKKSLTINDDSNALVVLINLSQAMVKGEKSY